MSRTLNGTSERLLDAIVGFWKAFGYSPSYRDLMATAGLSSASVVDYNLRKLRDLGYVSYEPGIARSIVLLEPVDAPARPP